METDNKRRCNHCHVNLPISHFNIKRSGEYCKQCIKCNNDDKKYRNKCEHLRQRHVCKDCKGSSICEHDRQRSKCRECGGSSICEHDRERSRCKECGGVMICSHNRVRSQCSDCGGTSTCIHKRLRHCCKYCNIAGCLRARIMNRMHSVLGYSDFDYLCCTIEEFIEHLENQFDETMNWYNYAEVWEMDHILPLLADSVDTDEIINRLCYTNVRPLSLYENRSRNNRKIL